MTFLNPTLYYQCLSIHVSELCSKIQVGGRHASLVGEYRPRQCENWFLGEGERNLNFLCIKHTDRHTVHSQIYCTFVILKFYWGGIRGKQRSKKTPWVKGGANEEKFELH